jgi:hypothetical protein
MGSIVQEDWCFTSRHDIHNPLLNNTLWMPLKHQIFVHFQSTSASWVSLRFKILDAWKCVGGHQCWHSCVVQLLLLLKCSRFAEGKKGLKVSIPFVEVTYRGPGLMWFCDPAINMDIYICHNMRHLIVYSLIPWSSKKFFWGLFCILQVHSRFFFWFSILWCSHIGNLLCW